jgi:hypothetical protein
VLNPRFEYSATTVKDNTLAGERRYYNIAAVACCNFQKFICRAAANGFDAPLETAGREGGEQAAGLSTDIPPGMRRATRGCKAGASFSLKGLFSDQKPVPLGQNNKVLFLILMEVCRYTAARICNGLHDGICAICLRALKAYGNAFSGGSLMPWSLIVHLQRSAVWWR